MKRYSLLLLSLFFLLSLKSVGQNESTIIPLTNSGFENWSSGNGYSVTVLFFPLAVYDSYTYPTGWNYPTYPVDETISYSGMNVNVNTDLPLLKVSNETSGVPEGSHAVKLQSFMLSDIISSTVYGLASSSLDESLTTTVFPTVLSTGVIDIDQLLPLMDDLTSNLDNLPQLVSVFSGVDLNNLIAGGISLNGEIMGRMTGYYKYTSAVGGDNGGILLLGSKYNSATHRRELVGVGYTTAMTDVSNYTPFEINYSPLSEIDDTYTYVQADSLVIMLLSSANTSPQQGSALYLDNLQLWTGFPPVVVPDTCSAVFNLTVNSVDTSHANLSWTYEGTPDRFESEYGIQGFVLGQGTPVTPVGNSLSLSDLVPDTYYDVYVRSVCGDDVWGEWSMVTFHTDTMPVVIILPTFGDTSATVCGSFNWYGEELTTSGDYPHLFENGNAAGGDSTVTLHLTINQPTEGDTIATACGSFNWYGEELTISGDYPHLFENGNANGCDSTVILHLTINQGTYNSIDTTVCDSYEWHDSTYTESGTYVFEYTNETDCPSADTLHLTVITINTYIGETDGVMSVVEQENATYQWINCETNEWIVGETLPVCLGDGEGYYACIITIGECTDTTECWYLWIDGISENSSTNITLYPNPTTGIITVNMTPETLSLNPEIYVLDMHGRWVETIKTFHKTSIQVDLSPYANGIYLLKVTDGTGRVLAVQKVVKE